MPDLPPLSLLAPPLLLVAALVLAARPGRRPPAVGWLPQGAALVALHLWRPACARCFSPDLGRRRLALTS